MSDRPMFSFDVCEDALAYGVGPILSDTPRTQGGRAEVLLVDDDPVCATMAHATLAPHYRVAAASGGKPALDSLDGGLRPDLILLDMIMPQMDGCEFMHHLRQRKGLADTPVIFVSGLDDRSTQAKALELGAVDFVLKPWDSQILLARVGTHIKQKKQRDLLHGYNAVLQTEVTQRRAEFAAMQTIGLRALSRLAETRDPETGLHLLRTKAHVLLLADLLRYSPRFAHVLTDDYIAWLGLSAPLHDIGKVGLPDHVLLKPGKLTPEERAIMERHSALGADAIALAEADAGVTLPFLQVAKEMARHHHENWDGSGYPDGLSGEDIPLSARLMAVGDVFDALVSRRVYKEPMDFDLAYHVMAQGVEKQFDPDLLDAFLSHYEDFTAIAMQHLDTKEDLMRKHVTLHGNDTIN